MEELEKLREKVHSIEMTIAKRGTAIDLNTKWLIVCSAIVLAFMGYTNLVSIPKSAQEAARTRLDAILPENLRVEVEKTLGMIEEQRQAASLKLAEIDSALKIVEQNRQAAIGKLAELNRLAEQGSKFTVKTYALDAEHNQHKKIELIDSEGSFCYLSKVSGKFMGDGEWARVFSEGGKWHLEVNVGAASNRVVAEATAIVFRR